MATALVAGACSNNSGQTAGASGTCTPEAPTAALSANWTTLQAHDGDYTFKFPGTWDKLYGASVFNTASFLDPRTFAETGLPSSAQSRTDLVREPLTGVPNASVLIVPGSPPT